MAIYGYCRISCDGRDTVSIEMQQEIIIRYAANRLPRATIEWIIDRGVSGSLRIAGRPEGRKLLDRLRRGDDLIVAKIDRLFRSMADGAVTIAKLSEDGVGLHCLDLGVDTTSPTGRVVAHVMIAFAELERSRIGERLRDARRYRRASRLPTMDARHAPLGWRIARDAEGRRQFERWQEERSQCRRVAKLRRRLIALRAEGQIRDAIALELAKLGEVSLRDGSAISPSRVRRMIIASDEDFPLISRDTRRWGSERPH